MTKDFESYSYQEMQEYIRKQDFLYYEKHDPEISDNEYDAAMARLKELEKTVQPGADSPTRVVNGAYVPSNKLNRVKHEAPMLSIENTYSEDELISWMYSIASGLNQVEWVVELKIDGVSASLIYEDGRLLHMITRGDGTFGDDVSANAVMLQDVPKLIPYKGRLEVRGEVYMTHEDLAQLNAVRSLENLPAFMNPRNTVAGSMALGYDNNGIDVERDDSVTEAKKEQIRHERSTRKLQFFFHSVGNTEAIPANTHWEFLEEVKRLGFTPTPMAAKFDTIKDTIRYCRYLIENIDSLNFEVDGVVIKVNSFDQRNILKATSKSPRWVIAYKFQKYEAVTVVTDVVFQIGKTGVITPVVEVVPCSIAGTTVRRSTLHNFDEVKRLDLRLNDTIIMEKAGKIIPHVVRVEKHLRDSSSRPLIFPSTCPACGGPITKDADTVYYRCNNPSCPAQLLARLRHFASREVMDITGLGEKNIERMVAFGLLTSIADFYKLKDARQNLITAIYGYGREDREDALQADNILASIENSKTRGLERVIHGLSVRNVGSHVAKVLCRRYSNYNAILQATEEEMTSLPEIGETIAHSLYQFLHEQGGAALLQELDSLGVKLSSEESKQMDLAGKTFVLTGTFHNFSRKELTEKLESRGCRVSDSVSRNTDLLVLGDNPGSKVQKAAHLGVAIIGEEELITTYLKD